jgi:hypothetical protein
MILRALLLCEALDTYAIKLWVSENKLNQEIYYNNYFIVDK